MIEFRPARPEETAARKALWHAAFGDDEAYIDRYHARCAPLAQSMVMFDEGTLVGAAELIPVTLVDEAGIKYRCAYVYAVCIHPDHQHQGLGGALVSYCDFYLEQKGMDGAVTVPATASLHRFYAIHGYGECFRHRQFRPESLPEPNPGDTVRETEAPRYDEVRERLLSDRLHVAYGGELMGYQRELCRGSGGALYLLQTDGAEGCACVEGTPEGGPVVKELLTRPGTEPRALAALTRAMGRTPAAVRVPDPAGERFGMIRWYRQDIARDWDWVNATGYLGLAFD